MAAGEYSIPTGAGIKVQQRIIGIIRDNFATGLIPTTDEEGEPYVSRVPYLEDLDVSMGVQDWNAMQAAANAKLKYLDILIHGRQVKLAFSARDLRRSGEEIINSKTDSIFTKWAQELDKAIWHGNYEGAVKLGEGLIEQLTDVNAKITEAQATSIIAYENALVMIQNIAPEYRSQFPIVLMMDWKTYDLLGSGPGVTGFTVLAIDSLRKLYPNVFIFATDTILSTAANVPGGTDAVGTNGRMLAFAQNADLLRRVVPKDPSPIGPAIVNLLGNTDQLWGALWGLKVIKATATTYTGTVLTF